MPSDMTHFIKFSSEHKEINSLIVQSNCLIEQYSRRLITVDLHATKIEMEFEIMYLELISLNVYGFGQ